ncbi:phenylacetate-CoA oxygenase [Paraburkholderia megapolitana]|nr:phenylacetate-CoA oxygenase [Paraburkholderia megapolitana]QDQ83471.1 phenylacetate-CoA oxygenase [Paraburkholderia megapolitana]QDQ85434.1 phenylacetate-CoA oxygenase [Paraburkholderia megapolitana]QDQ85600.1 phenylacetate-CoA oxygenase [Paraburkholderia megapolitana]
MWALDGGAPRERKFLRRRKYQESHTEVSQVFEVREPVSFE